MAGKWQLAHLGSSPRHPELCGFERSRVWTWIPEPGGDELCAATRIAGQHDDVQARGFERRDGQWRVQVGGYAEVDCVDVGVSKELGRIVVGGGAR